MRNRILVGVIIILSFVLIGVSSRVNTTFFNTLAKQSIAVKNVQNEVNKMDLEKYVVGIVAAEMPASFNEEALKAQAIASRTYAMYKIQTSQSDYDVVTDVSNQSYIDIDEMHTKWQDDFDFYYNRIKQAVDDTKGLVLTYNDEIIESFYFAMSNGFTEDASLVFGEDKSYLESVVSIYDNSNLKNFEVTTNFNKEEVCQKLNISCNSFNIEKIERSKTNRVNLIVINGKSFKGTEFRSLLNLRSTDFDIVDNTNEIMITTRGYGHGVGMSQYGANGMANAGKNYQDILNYFYKNVKISSI